MRLIQVGLHAEDLDRAEAFYHRLLGEAPTARFDPPGLLFFDLAGTRLLLDVGAPASLLYLQVDDLHATIDRLRADGVHIEAEPHFIYEHADDRWAHPAPTSGRRSCVTPKETLSGWLAS